ncbi:MAG: hypothetical protein U0638_17060 [Phycisphaerales bacterium]
MQTRQNSPARMLLAAAAFSGATLLGATSALAQIATPRPSSDSNQPASAAHSAMDKAAKLLEQGQVVRARTALASLLNDDSAGQLLSNRERQRLNSLVASISRQTTSMDPVELSLQRAENDADQGNIRSAEAHLQSVVRSHKATSEQNSRIEAVRSICKASKSTMAPKVDGLLTAAESHLHDGRVADAKSDLSSIGRSGLVLEGDQLTSFNSLTDRIDQIDANNADKASLGLLETQPGVVKKRPIDPYRDNEEAKPAEKTTEKPAEQPAADAPAPAAQPAQAPAEPPAQPPAEQPAATPPAAEQPSGWQPPQGQDAIEQSRKWQAQELLAQADLSFDKGIYNDSLSKYQQLAGAFSQYLTVDELARVNARISEAQVRLNANGIQLDPLSAQMKRTQVQKEAAVAEFNNQVSQASKALDTGDTERARNLAAAARLTINSNKNAFAESEVEGYNKQVADLLAKIAGTEDTLATQRAANQAKALADEASKSEAQRLSEKERKVREALTRIRALQMEMKYAEAIQVVDQLLYLDPINPAGLVLRDVLTDQMISIKSKEISKQSWLNVARHNLDNTEAAIPPLGIIDYPSDWPAISAIRGEPLAFAESAENQRVNSLIANKKTPVKFNDSPLDSVVGFLQAVTLLNIDVDWASLEGLSVQRDKAITLNLTNVPMKTVLDKVCEKVSPGTDISQRVGWAVNDGVLTIAAEEALRKNTQLVIYDIRDLLIEVPSYNNVPKFDLSAALQSSGQGGGSGQSPFQSGNQNNQQTTFSGNRDARIDQLIQIIQENVDSEGWKDLGGTTGSVQRLDGSLIIVNTAKNHQAINGLLRQLREVRAMQISVESRILLVDQEFFEQIGFDIDVYLNANNNQVRTARAVSPTAQASDFFSTENGSLQRTASSPNLATGTFASQGVVNPRSWSPIGLTQASNSLAASLLSGQVDGSSVASSALSSAPALGIAGQFLDDVQVDFLIQATQADRRSIRLNAPRLTLTNGQTSNVSVTTQIAYVTNLQAVVSDSAAAFTPTIGVAFDGVLLVVEGTVSADRRYVTMNVQVSVSKLDGFKESSVTAVAGGRLVNSADTQSFFQLPTNTVTQLSSTVTIPDQGTIMMGGQRVTNEFDVETGVPVLSKIPVINRLFSNRIKAKDDHTLLILLKPTILIQNEQEEKNFPGLLDTLRAPYGG